MQKPSAGFYTKFFFVRGGEIIACGKILKLGGLMIYSPRKFLKFMTSEIASETTFTNKLQAQQIISIIMIVINFPGGEGEFPGSPPSK